MMKLSPRLVVPSAAKASEFYKAAFRAEETRRDSDDAGHIVNLELRIGHCELSLTEEARHWHNHAPGSLGGTPVILSLEVDDPDALWARALAHGAQEIFALADQPYGHRAGRLRDPFGHMWLIYKVLPSFG